MDAKEELLRIIDQFNLIYESEEAWHGPSVVEVLSDVSWEMAAEKIMPNTHSIAELVYHMTTWRIFVVKRLQGDGEYEVTKARDWKTFPIFDEFEWEALQMELSLSQEELIAELEKEKMTSFWKKSFRGVSTIIIPCFTAFYNTTYTMPDKYQSSKKPFSTKAWVRKNTKMKTATMALVPATSMIMMIDTKSY